VNHSNETGDLYIDGVKEIDGLSSSISLDTNPFRINYFMRGYNGMYTDGMLDDIRVYDHSLTQGAVTALFEGPMVPEPSSFLLLGLGSLILGRRARSWRKKA
jgi:hypothetical protein